jgi:putative two-component system response regulator
MACQNRILIVDDVPENIQMAMNILQEDNYEFSFAQNGAEALTILEQGQSEFDLILLDVMMPILDGFEVCKKLKASSKLSDIPIIFLTARTDSDSIAHGFEIGGADYVTKPFHASELLARVRTNINSYHAKQLLKQSNIDLEVKSHYEKIRLTTELEDNQKEMIWILTELMEATSDETGKHIRRVAEISALLARYHPSLSSDDETVLYHASPMHDIGKMTIPQEILHKPGRYTEEEFEIMKKHTTNAYHLLSKSDRKLLKAAATIAYEHHEKWNGSGYPRGLKGHEIHIYGRVVALADVFDALTHVRSYKTAWKIEEAVTYIKEHSETQFDPQLVSILVDHVDEFVAIANIT